jgi:hypothetical protein
MLMIGLKPLGASLNKLRSIVPTVARTLLATARHQHHDYLTLVAVELCLLNATSPASFGTHVSLSLDINKLVSAASKRTL